MKKFRAIVAHGLTVFLGLHMVWGLVLLTPTFVPFLLWVGTLYPPLAVIVFLALFSLTMVVMAVPIIGFHALMCKLLKVPYRF